MIGLFTNFTDQLTELLNDIPLYRTSWTLQIAWLLALWHLMLYFVLKSPATTVVKHHLCKGMIKHVCGIKKVVSGKGIRSRQLLWAASMWRTRTHKKKVFCHRHCKYKANLQNSKLLEFFLLFKNLYFYFIWGLWRCHLCWPVISWLKNKGWNLSFLSFPV